MWITPDKGNDELHFVELAQYPMKTTEIQFKHPMVDWNWADESGRRIDE